MDDVVRFQIVHLILMEFANVAKKNNMTQEQIKEHEAFNRLAGLDHMDYYEQKKLNEEQFLAMVKAIRPDIGVIMETLDSTQVNWKVIWKVIYALQNISSTTKYGQVNILVENNIVRFVRGESSDKINEPVLLVVDELGNEKMSEV